MGIITDRVLQAKPTGKDRWITEDAPRGHGRFMARITKSGDRLFYFRYTDPAGARAYIPLGAYDNDGAAGLTLQEARAKAGELSRLYQSGVTDIKGHFEAEKTRAEAEQAAHLAKLAADQAAQARVEARITVSTLFDRWASVDLIRRKDGGAEIRRMFEKDVLPKIGHIPVEDVRKGDVTGVTDALLARGVTRMAKMIFSLMRQMFRFAVDRDIIEFEPTASIRKAKIGGKDVERDRVLSEDEIKALALQLPGSGLSDPAQCAVWLTLSTCCRIGELLQSRWEHVDLDRGVWWIPPENSKNGKAHTVYLSDFALGQFQALKDRAGEILAEKRTKRREAKPSEWVYPNRLGNSSVCEKTVTKQVGDRQRPGLAPMKGRAKADKTDTLVLVGGKWTPHDLRRTGATMMVKLGVLPEVAERCLNHTEENRVKRIYQRHSYENEMREAWRLLGDRLALLENPEASNVVTLKRA